MVIHAALARIEGIFWDERRVAAVLIRLDVPRSLSQPPDHVSPILNSMFLRWAREYSYTARFL